MATKRTGIFRDLIIHPGETIADVLEERGITQAELAVRTGVSTAYISSLISGKKNISTKFAMSLEYALGVPKSFWLNLQANYDSELLELNEESTISEEERQVYKNLEEVVKYFKQKGAIPNGKIIEDNILALRKAFQISNLTNLKSLVPAGAFRMDTSVGVDPYILGAWLRLCQISGEDSAIPTGNIFDTDQTESLISDIKRIMLDHHCDLQKELSCTMKKYGIDFSVVKNFRGAPVHGYISQRKDGIYQMVVTIRGSFADIFWFSLFHEIGHLVNGDVSKGSKFIDSDNHDNDKEQAANLFASTALLTPESYKRFVNKGDFSYSAIEKYASSQHVMPYIVIGRLQKEKHIPYSWYSQYKLRYKWA